MKTKAMLIAALAAGACAHYPDYPVTEHGMGFSRDLNAGSPHVAPDVASRVTAARLEAARSEPQNWLTYYGAYDGQRFSALDQINTSNVKSLRPAWVFQSASFGVIAAPATYAFEATPIVVDGVMFVTGPDAYVWAIDARTGKLLWTYKHAVPLDVPLCCGNVNRGVAVANGRVVFATPHGHVIALDARDGHALWDQIFVDVRAGESATMAPLIVENLVLVGSSGAEYGVRGHIDAFDLETGRRVWRKYNVPKPGEPGSETWQGDTWARGGGTAWITGSYDPELNLVYWSTGNPGPDFDGDARPGDNLYTNSLLAFTPEDGRTVWHFQFTPHDVWDYDAISENILFDRDGRKLVAHFDKNGHLYVLDRTNGKLLSATPFARVTWGEVDRGTGRITPRAVPTTQGTLICPGPAGAKEWPHASYSRATGLLYVPVVEACGTYTLKPSEFKESLAYWGGEVEVDTVQWGNVKAFDPATGEMKWDYRTRFPVVSSILSTDGGLIFVGEATGELDALDARTGEVLWQFQTGNGIHGSPITYSVDGKQYVAIWSGWGGWMKGFDSQLYGAPRGSGLFAFALP